MQAPSRARRGSCGLWWLAALALAAVLIALIVLNSGPTSIKLAVVARDYQAGPVGAGSLFNPEDNPLHCVVKLEHASKGVRVKFVWTVIEAAGQQNYKLNEREVILGSGQDSIDAYLSLPHPWPPGAYKIDIFLEDKPANTLNFTVADIA